MEITNFWQESKKMVSMSPEEKSPIHSVYVCSFIVVTFCFEHQTLHQNMSHSSCDNCFTVTKSTVLMFTINFGQLKTY